MGGRGSSKSHTAAQLSIGLMCGHFVDFGFPEPPLSIASARDYNVNLSKSVKVAVELYVKKLGLTDEIRVMEEKIVHKNGSRIDFIGIKTNIDNVLSLEDYFVFWIEQAEFVTVEMMEKIEPTMRKETTNKFGQKVSSEIWSVWNPGTRASWSWMRFEVHPEKGDVHHRINFNDNPWWSETQDKVRRKAREMNPSRYNHVYLGTPDDGNTEEQVLPYSLLKLCVEAYEKYSGYAKLHHNILDAGFDIAEGGVDMCSLVVRSGPCVEDCRMWRAQAGDLDLIAEDADRYLREITGLTDQIWTMYYDGQHAMEGPLNRASNGRYMNEAVQFGGAVAGKDNPFDTRSLNGEIFERRNIQMGMALRIKANKTAALMNGRDVPIYECLFINPKLMELESFLSMCTKPIKRTGPVTGKLQIDKRGGDENAKSPDEFDALCLAFARDSANGIRDF